DQDRAYDAVTEIADNGGRAIAVEADVSQPKQVRRLFEITNDEFGGVDILVNNASVEINKFIWNLGDDEWRHVLANSLDSVFFCSKYVLPYMIPRGGGKIVNISSIHDTVPRKMSTPYCVSKAGLLMFTETLALELAPYNVQVNAVSPGVILTERTHPNFSRGAEFLELNEQVLKINPTRRPGIVEEAVAPVLYLCSPHSGYTSGTTLYVDGAYRHNLVPMPEGDALPHLEALKGDSQ
ncbi:MAG: SDR family oxidoreductase, partial [Rhodothermales bacterium]|nr:SDR family oxidoreductase [Rhodothermales bacterium]